MYRIDFMKTNKQGFWIKPTIYEHVNEYWPELFDAHYRLPIVYFGRHMILSIGLMIEKAEIEQYSGLIL